jgi:uncharacterized protein YerC
MPRASHRPVNKNLDQDLKENFSSLIATLNTPSEIRQFFNDFLTSEEQTMLTKRLMLHLMIERGYRSSQIQKVLGITKETIRVHRRLEAKGNVLYKRVLRKIDKKAEQKMLWKKLEKTLRPAGFLLTKRSAGKQEQGVNLQG